MSTLPPVEVFSREKDAVAWIREHLVQQVAGGKVTTARSPAMEVAMLHLADGVSLTVVKDSAGWRFYAWERIKGPGTIGPLFESPRPEDRERCFETSIGSGDGGRAERWPTRPLRVSSVPPSGM